MEKSIISSKQLISIMILFIVGSSLITGTSTIAKQDSWISIIIAMFMAVPLALIYARLSKLFPEKNIYDIIYHIFGKKISFLISILYVFYALLLGALVIRNFTEYIQISSLPETPQFIFAIFMGTICFWVLKHGIEVLGRGCVFILPFVVFVVLITLILTIKDMNFSNIEPMLGQDFKTILSGSFSSLLFPFGEVVLFLAVLPTLRKKSSPYKAYIISIFIGGGILVVAMVRNILVLGVPTMNSLYFSSYYAASILDIGEFLSRIEVLVTGNFVVTGIVKTAICLYSSTVGIAKVFNIDNYKLLLAPTMLFIIAFSGLIFKNAMEMFKYIDTFRYYDVFFQFILPMVILIFAEIKVRKDKRALKCDVVC